MAAAREMEQRAIIFATCVTLLPTRMLQTHRRLWLLLAEPARIRFIRVRVRLRPALPDVRRG